MITIKCAFFQKPNRSDIMLLRVDHQEVIMSVCSVNLGYLVKVCLSNVKGFSFVFTNCAVEIPESCFSSHHLLLLAAKDDPFL